MKTQDLRSFCMIDFSSSHLLSRVCSLPSYVLDMGRVHGLSGALRAKLWDSGVRLLLTTADGCLLSVFAAAVCAPLVR